MIFVPRGSSSFAWRWFNAGAGQVLIATLLLAVIFAVQFGTGAAASVATPAGTIAVRSQSVAPSVQFTSCESSLPDGTECGILTTSAVRSIPGSQPIYVPFLRYRAAVAKVAKPPVVYLNPGSAVAKMKEVLAAGMFPGRDVVILEERGTSGQAEFSCPAAPAAQLTYLSSPSSTSQEHTSNAKAFASVLSSCVTKYSKSGRDLRSLTVPESGADAIELRRLLDYPKWIIVGEDASASQAAYAATHDKDGVLATVLDGSAFPNISRYRDVALQEALQLATATAKSRNSFDSPTVNLPQDLADVIKDFNDSPMSVSVANPLASNPVTIKLSGQDIALLVQQALRSPELVPYTGTLMQQLKDRNPAAVKNLIERALTPIVKTNIGLEWIYRCRLDSNPVPISRLYDTNTVASICKNMKVTPDNLRFSMKQPLLGLIGSNNPYSSPVATSTFVKSQPQGVAIPFAGETDGMLRASTCAQKFVYTWLDKPTKSVKPPTCATARFPASLGGDVASAPRFAPQIALDNFNIFSPLLIPFLFALIAPFWALGWVGGVLKSVFTRRERIGHLLLGIAPLASLLFVVIAGASLWTAFNQDRQIFLVGVPQTVAAAGWLLVPAGLGCLAYFFARRWFDGILACIAVFGFSAWFAWSALGWF